MTSLLLIRVNCPDRETADIISAALIAEKLAPCTNLTGPVVSTYVWQGEVETAEEWVLWIKAQATAWPAIETRVSELHPYDVPAVLAVPVAEANSPYAQWVLDNTGV